MRELEGSLQLLVEGKSNGENQIDNAMFKRLPPSLQTIPSGTHQQNVDKGSFILDWNSSTIIPIHKAGKEPSDTQN